MGEKYRDRTSREAIKWFLRRATLNGKQYADFEAWLEKDAANARAYSEIMEIWDLIGTIPAYQDRDADRSKTLN